MGSIARNVFRVRAAALVALFAASTSAEVHRFTEETMRLLMLESLNVPEAYAEPEEGPRGPMPNPGRSRPNGW